MQKKIISIAISLLLIVVMFGIMANPVLASTVYESYTTGDDGYEPLQSTGWYGQTFTPSASHTVTSVKLYIYRFGSPGTITASIRATSAGLPTGSDLCSGTTNGNTLPTSLPYEVREITLGAGAALISGTVYAIVVRAPSGDASNYVKWRVDTSSPSYSGGSAIGSGDSGSNWSATTTEDTLFEEWGNPTVSAPTITLSAASSITTTTATLNGNVTATGNDNPSVTVYWGTTDHPGTASGWDHNSAPTSPSQPQGVAAFYYNASTLVSNTTYYFTAKATNSAGTSWPASSQSFATLNTATITLSAASSVAATTATLNGNITVAGSSNPTVTVYYGTTDHPGTSTGWDNSVAPTSPGQPQGVAAFYYNASSLSTGTTYYFTAKAVNSAGTSWPAASVSFLTIPAAPTGVGATDGGYSNKVTVTWAKSTGATGYKVLRGATNDSGTLGDVASYDDIAGSAPTITPGTADATDGTNSSYVTCTLTGQSASIGSTESYTVYAYNASGWSAASTADNGYKGTTTLTYQWQRSDADSDAAYNTNTGTSNPYNDPDAPSNGDKRYFRAVVSMAGATNQNSTANEGYRAVAPVVVLSNAGTLSGIPTATSISLRWTMATNAISTRILYRTDRYPASIGDGTIVGPGLITGNSFVQTGLTAGTTYYFSAYGFDGMTYSQTPSHLIMNTQVSTSTVSGGDALPIPVFPSQWNQTPNSTGLSRFEPFYSIVNTFAADWQIPQDNGWLGLILFGIAFLGIVVYIKVKDIFISLFVSEFAMVVGIFTLGVPAWMAVIPLVFGLGVWAIEHNFQ